MNATPIDRSDRREWLVVLAISGVAAMLRIWGLGHLGLTHFDEGVYAASGIWSLSPGGLARIDPDVIPYAPPLYPILVGLAYLVLGPSDAAPLLVSIGCGVATIPVTAWVARRTFGPGAGAAAAAFAALAMAHVAFSRKALTDAPFLLVWMASLGIGGRFLERPGFGRALALGLIVGLAQNTKYNGALTGVVVALSALLTLVVLPEARTRSALGRTFGWGAFAALVAGLTYLPWYLHVESHGGYAALMRHHGGYVGPVSSWLPHWRQQLAQVVALSGGPTWSAAIWPVAWFGASLAACGTKLVAGSTGLDWTRLRIGALVGAAVMAGFLDVGWWIGAAWFPWLLIDRRPAVRLLGAGWLLMSAITPFYHPYARLWLPLHGMGWLLLAGAVVTCGPFNLAASTSTIAWGDLRRQHSFLARGILALVCLVLARQLWNAERPEPFRVAEFFRPTDSIRVAAHDLATSSRFPVGQGATLRVLGRRPLAFYLALEGSVPIQLVADAAGIVSGPVSASDWALVDDAVTPLERSLAQPPLSRPTRYGVTWIWDERRDPVTRLDVTPASAFDPSAGRRGTLTLLRPVPNTATTRAPGRSPIGPASPPTSPPTDTPR